MWNLALRSCHLNNTDPGHARLVERITKNGQTNFATPPKNAVEKKKVKKRKRKAIAGLFALHANTITETLDNNRN